MTMNFDYLLLHLESFSSKENFGRKFLGGQNFIKFFMISSAKGIIQCLEMAKYKSIVVHKMDFSFIIPGPFG